MANDNDNTPYNNSTSMTQNESVLRELEDQEESGDESDDLELTDENLAQHGGIKTEEKPPAKTEEKPSIGGGGDDDDDDGNGSSSDVDDSTSDDEDKDKDIDGEDSNNEKSKQEEDEEDNTNVKSRDKKKKLQKRNAKTDTNDDTKDLVGTRKSKRRKKGCPPSRYCDSLYANDSIKAAAVSSSTTDAALSNSAKGTKGVLCSDLANSNRSDIIMEPGNAILTLTKFHSSYSMVTLHNMMSVVSNPATAKSSDNIKKKKKSKQPKKIVSHGPETLLTVMYRHLLKMYKESHNRYAVNMHACTFMHDNMLDIVNVSFHDSFIFLYSFLVSEACFNDVGVDQISEHMFSYIKSNTSENMYSRVRKIESEIKTIMNTMVTKNMRTIALSILANSSKS